jgi:hypothetical protein
MKPNDQRVHSILISLAAVLVLAACGNSEKMSTEKASDVLADYYKANKDLCTWLGEWPVQVPTRELSSAITSILTDSLGARMLALESVGLVKKSQRVENANGTLKSAVSVTNFDLTSEGQQFYQQHDRVVLTLSLERKELSRKEICFATRTLKNVSSVVEKALDGKPSQAIVTYSIDVQPRGSWVTNKVVAQAFPEFSADLKVAGKELHRTLLWNDGKWVVVGT